MENINKVKSMSIWVFLVPFVAVNTCLILVTQFHELFPNQQDVLINTIPYFDGGASISRTARPYPSWLVFKPAMFLTAFLLIKYATRELFWKFNCVPDFIFPFIRTSHMVEEICRIKIISTNFLLWFKVAKIFAGTTWVLLKTRSVEGFRCLLRLVNLSCLRVCFVLSTTSKRD